MSLQVNVQCSPKPRCEVLACDPSTQEVVAAGPRRVQDWPEQNGETCLQKQTNKSKGSWLLNDRAKIQVQVSLMRSVKAFRFF